MNTLTVDPNSRHTIVGNRLQALRHYTENDVALWVRATGKATLFYSEDGKRRQKTWNSIRLLHN
jgi:hypothetical protein